MKAILTLFKRVGPKRWFAIAAVLGPGLLIYAFFPMLFLSRPELPPSLSSVKKDKVILIDLDKQVLYAYEEGNLKHRFLCVTSKAWYRTPPGFYKTSQHDAKYRSKAYNAPMPYAMRITHWGHYIHAGLAVKMKWRMKKALPSGMSKDIGSHGCVNLEYFDAKELFDWAPESTPVLVTYNDPVVDTIYNSLMGRRGGMTVSQLYTQVFRGTVTKEEIERGLKVLKKGVADAQAPEASDQEEDAEPVWFIRWTTNPELSPS